MPVLRNAAMKSRRPALSFRLLVISAALVLIPASAQALPSAGDATVVSGSVSFASGVSDLAITQFTPSAIINWNSFSLGAGESLTLAQPSSSGATLLRFGGGSPVHLGGTLVSLGGIYIVSEAGLDLSGANISAQWIWLADTNISDANFLAGNFGTGSAGGTGGNVVIGGGGAIISIGSGTGGEVIVVGGGGTISGGTTPIDPNHTANPVLAIPEPGTYAMMLAGLAMMLAKATRRRKPRF